MYETKSQLRIIAALIIVVVALAAGLLFYMPTAQEASANPTPQTPSENAASHEKIRDAEICLEPSLIFSQTFGGSGNESIVKIFYNENCLYIFGNTDSSDYDFDKAGAFLAIIGTNGKTQGFFSYDGELKAVTLYDGGFVMAIDRNSSPIAMAVSYEGIEIASLAIPSGQAEIALDIKYIDTGYVFVAKTVQNITGFMRLKMTMLSRNLQFIGSLVTDEVYSLEYITTIDKGGELIVMANALSDLKNMLCKGEWGKKLAHYPLEYSYIVKDFWIIDSFYYLAVTDSATLLIKEDGSTITLTDDIGSSRMIGCKDYMYISVGENFFCVKGDKVLFSSEYGDTSFYASGDYVYSVSNKGSKITVRSFLDGNKAFEVTFSSQLEAPKIITCESGMFIVGSTKGKFGGDDITVLKVDY